MSDPISLAGTGIGILSLGIQVCRELHDYISAIQSQDETLRAVEIQSHYMESVYGTLQRLIVEVQTLLPPEKILAVTFALKSCMLESEGKLEKLQRVLNGCRRRASNTRQQKMTDIGRKLSFPFKQGDIQRIQDNLQALALKAGFALEIINSYDLFHVTSLFSTDLSW